MASFDIKDCFDFEKMLTPVFIKVVYWLLLALAILGGLIQIIVGLASKYNSGRQVLMGLSALILGPIFVRIFCELLIVVFSINGHLADMKPSLDPPSQEEE
jgi:hypothetical protein